MTSQRVSEPVRVSSGFWEVIWSNAVVVIKPRRDVSHSWKENLTLASQLVLVYVSAIYNSFQVTHNFKIATSELLFNNSIP